MTGPGAGVVVVGGGIIGTACAWALADDGWPVTLVEAGELGGGTTAAGMGHLVTLDSSEAILRLTQYSIREWRRLESQLPGSVAMNPCGTLWVASTEEEFAALERRAGRLRAHGANLELVDGQELEKLEPVLRPGLSGALWVRDDAVLIAQASATYFAQEAAAKGARILVGRRVDRIEPGKVTLDGQEVLAGEHVLNAAGPRAGRLSPQARVSSRKGQLMRLTSPVGPAHHLTEAGYGRVDVQREAFSVIFTVQPLPDGSFLLGASRQNGVEDPSVDPEVLDALLERASRIVPGIRSLPVLETRAGFRPATPDDLPLIGWTTDGSGTLLATGHEGFGVTTAVGTAYLVRDLLAGRNTAIPVTPYRPERFDQG